MANLNDLELCELEEVVQMYDDWVEKSIGKKPSHFEHGSVSVNGNGGNSIYHFHYHNIITDMDIEDEICKEIGIPYEEVESYLQIKGKGNDYLLYENKFDRKFIFNIKIVIESQFLRKLVHLHSEEPYKAHSYDWKRYDCERLFVENKRRLKSIVQF